MPCVIRDTNVRVRMGHVRVVQDIPMLNIGIADAIDFCVVYQQKRGISPFFYISTKSRKFLNYAIRREKVLLQFKENS